MNIFKIWWTQWTLWPKVISIAVIAALLIAVIVGVRSCGKREPKLNETEIQQGEQAVKDRNDAKLKEILAASDAREKEIDTTVANAEAEKQRAAQESKERYANMNTSELAAELEKRK